MSFSPARSGDLCLHPALLVMLAGLDVFHQALIALAERFR